MDDSKLLPVVQDTLTEYGLVYSDLECDPELADTAAFCEAYNFKLEQSANTIVVASRKIEPTQYAVCVVLATTQLDVNNTVRKLLGVKKLSFADAETTAQLTGMQIGGVTAVGIRDLPIYIDSLVMNQSEVVMGGGNRSSKIVLTPNQLLKLNNVKVIDGLAKPKPQ